MIPQAYIAAAHERWRQDKDGYLQRNLSVHAVIGRVAGYELWKKTATNGHQPKPEPKPPGYTDIREIFAMYDREFEELQRQEKERASWPN